MWVRGPRLKNPSAIPDKSETNDIETKHKQRHTDTNKRSYKQCIASTQIHRLIMTSSKLHCESSDEATILKDIFIEKAVTLPTNIRPCHLLLRLMCHLRRPSKLSVDTTERTWNYENQELDSDEMPVCSAKVGTL